MMATITQETRLELASHELVSLSGMRGYTVSCESGELWITIDGDGRDMILPAGRQLSITSDAEVVISALKDTVFHLRHRRPFGQRAMGRMRSAVVSLLNWEMPPLASLPSTLIR